VVIFELPVVGKAGGQFLENLVRLRSKVVIDGTAVPRESHDQELCPARDDRSSKPEMISLVRRLRRFRTVVRWLVKTARVGDGARNGGPGAGPGGIDQRLNLFNLRDSPQFERRQLPTLSCVLCDTRQGLPAHSVADIG
jgi:hypothetical protein